MALLQGTNFLWGDPFEAALALTRPFPWTCFGAPEDLPSGAASPCPSGGAGLPVDKPRAVCPGTFRMRRPVGLRGGGSQPGLLLFRWGPLLVLVVTCPLVLPPLAGPPP